MRLSYYFYFFIFFPIIKKKKNLSISPSNQYSGLIFFRIDLFDLVVQGIFKNLLQHHSLKASVLWCSAFFMVHLSLLWSHLSVHDYWKNHNFDYMGPLSAKWCLCLLIHCLDFSIAFLPRRKRLNFEPQSPSTVILESNKIKSITVSTLPPSICHKVMGLDTMIFDFLVLSFKPARSPSSVRSLVSLHFLP